MKRTRKKRLINDSLSQRSMFTLHASKCFTIDNQVQLTFVWLHSRKSLSSIELIYHIDLIERKITSIPLRIQFKHSRSLVELITVNTYLQFDPNRDCYFISLHQYIARINNQNIIIGHKKIMLHQ